MMSTIEGQIDIGKYIYNAIRAAIGISICAPLLQVAHADIICPRPPIWSQATSPHNAGDRIIKATVEQDILLPLMDGESIDRKIGNSGDVYVIDLLKLKNVDLIRGEFSPRVSDKYVILITACDGCVAETQKHSLRQGDLNGKLLAINASTINNKKDAEFGIRGYEHLVKTMTGVDASLVAGQCDIMELNTTSEIRLIETLKPN